MEEIGWVNIGGKSKVSCIAFIVAGYRVFLAAFPSFLSAAIQEYGSI